MHECDGAAADLSLPARARCDRRRDARVTHCCGREQRGRDLDDLRVRVGERVERADQ